MAKTDQRYHGVHQRGPNSWAAAIYHSHSKKVIWLGTFKTAEAAAKAHDEENWIMSGQISKYNFPCPSIINNFKYLSHSVIGKLHCHMFFEGEDSIAGEGTGAEVGQATEGENHHQELNENQIKEMIEEIYDPNVSIEFRSTTTM